MIVVFSGFNPLILNKCLLAFIFLAECNYMWVDGEIKLLGGNESAQGVMDLAIERCFCRYG